ncbi:bacteriohemerythrin [Desulfolithobacter sp.]
MALIKWRKAYSVGIDRFDRQHVKIVELINEIMLVVLHKKSENQLHDNIESLIEYTRSHFAEEENAMESSGYPHLSEHKQEHAMLVQQVLVFHERIKNKDNVVTEFYQFLRTWLLDHIVTSDMKYGGFLMSRAGRSETVDLDKSVCLTSGS